MITVNTEGSYNLHLDYIFDQCITSNELEYEFIELMYSIKLVVKNKDGKEVYNRETDFLCKRRAIEVFFEQVCKMGLK